MTSTPDITAITLGVRDVERSRRFYVDGLGWEPTLWVGLLGTTAGLGYAMSLLVFPPYNTVEKDLA